MYHTEQVYSTTCRGSLSGTSCYSASNVHQILQKRKIPTEEYDFSSRVLAFSSVACRRKSMPDWLGEQAWDGITELDKLSAFGGFAASLSR